jgi:hypothetical protein
LKLSWCQPLATLEVLPHLLHLLHLRHLLQERPRLRVPERFLREQHLCPLHFQALRVLTVLLLRRQESLDQPVSTPPDQP